jgi:glycine cleavage system H protein
MNPTNLRYAKSHEWAVLDGTVCTVGITKFAVEQLTDVTYLKLPRVGDTLTQDKSFGEIESVKAVSDLYAPVSGTVAEVNTRAEADPSMIADDPFGKGWVVKITVPAGTTLDHLMTAEQYEAQIAGQGH